MQEVSSPIGKFIDPEAIIKQLTIKEGIVVADFGCGPGYFSIPFARAIGDSGKIFSFDVLPQALESVQSKAKSSGLSNIKTKRVNLEKELGSGLEDQSCDWVIIKDVLFQNQNKEIILKEAFRVMKKGGSILIIEWKEDDMGIGPEKSIRISENDLKKMIADVGFKIEKNIEAGDFHYAFVATK
jgi:ubiquinone/menaquinone biosynthesis C-methylase UbiE